MIEPGILTEHAANALDEMLAWWYRHREITHAAPLVNVGGGAMHLDLSSGPISLGLNIPAVITGGNGTPGNPYTCAEQQRVPSTSGAAAGWANKTVARALNSCWEWNSNTGVGIGTEVCLIPGALNQTGTFDYYFQAPGSGTGVLSAIRYFTASGTWTKPANLAFAIAEVQAGGGGGGGAQGGTNGSAAGGGGGGGYARTKIAAASLPATVAVTVAVSASGGAAGNNDGIAGTGSSFGTFAVASGGGAGKGAAASVNLTQSTDGGTSSLVVPGIGDLVIEGGAGGTGTLVVSGTDWLQTVGIGGRSYFSAGTRTAHSQALANHGGPLGQAYGGGAQNNYGAGGDGALGGLGGSDFSGMNGGNGLVIVYEYV